METLLTSDECVPYCKKGAHGTSRTVVETFVCILIIAAYVPQLRTLVRHGTRGLSSSFVLLHAVFSTTQLGLGIANPVHYRPFYCIAGSDYRAPATDCPVQPDFLRGWEAYSALLGAVQIAVQWVMAMVLLGVYSKFYVSPTVSPGGPAPNSEDAPEGNTLSIEDGETRPLLPREPPQQPHGEASDDKPHMLVSLAILMTVLVIPPAILGPVSLYRPKGWDGLLYIWIIWGLCSVFSFVHVLALVWQFLEQVEWQTLHRSAGVSRHSALLLSIAFLVLGVVQYQRFESTDGYPGLGPSISNSNAHDGMIGIWALVVYLKYCTPLTYLSAGVGFTYLACCRGPEG